MSATGEQGAATPPKADAHPAPDLGESLRQIGQTGRAGLGAAGDAAKAMRSLVAADISLARSALGRTLAMTGVAIVFGASAWLLLMAVLVVVLNARVGLSWSLSLLLPALLSGAAAWFVGWRAMGYFEHTRLQATRRQLARLGIGELSDFVPDAGSATSTRDATEQRPSEDAAGQPLKDERGVDVTPP
ncbi:MAG TPA: phage holin family protein [Lysobacter sp.]|nr:phage holin family protein [Lysobacter sp.]